MNEVCLTGRVAFDIELQKTAAGISYLKNTIAVKRPHVADKTDFIPFTAWRQSAEYLSKYAQKGDTIEIAGVLTSERYETAEGAKRTAYSVNADSVAILSSKRETRAERAENGQYSEDRRQTETRQENSGRQNARTSYKPREMGADDLDGLEIDAADLPF